MTGPTSGTVTGTVGIAAAMAFMPFGISLETWSLGAACFFGGCCCRTGITLYKKLNGSDPIMLEFFVRQIAAVFCCIPLAAVASLAVFLGAHVVNIEADAGCGGLLLIAGTRGIEGFQWVTDTLANVFERFLPKKPGGPVS